MGAATSGPLRLSFNPQLRVEFHGADGHLRCRAAVATRVGRAPGAEHADRATSHRSPHRTQSAISAAGSFPPVDLQPPGGLRGYQRRRAAGRGSDVSDAGLARAAGDERRAHLDAPLVRDGRPRGRAELPRTRPPQHGTDPARFGSIIDPAGDPRYRQLREPGPRGARAVRLQRPLRVRLLSPALRLQPGRRLPGRQAPAGQRPQCGRVGRGAPPRH